MCLLGFGTVGQALARLLAARPELSAVVRLVAAADRSGSAESAAGCDPERLLSSKRKSGSLSPIDRRKERPDLVGLASASDVDVVIDALPTNLTTGEPSRAIALAALSAGRHYVTANKGVLALHFEEVSAAAQRAGRRVLGSGTVCAGTPVLEVLRGAFRGDRVERIDGILNGSTNFILSRLEEGARWDDALAQARGLGILEANPSLDLLGLDAAAKAVILANHAWRPARRLADARVEGIWGLSAGEAKEARDRGLAIRLLARADNERGVTVAPVALPREHPLVLSGAENAVRLKLENAGLVTVKGPGAGGRETAGAILSDVLSLATRAD